MSLKILLTGGAGYIGSHVAHLLIDKGHSVSIIDSLTTGSKKLVPKKPNFMFAISVIRQRSQKLFNKKNLM